MDFGSIDTELVAKLLLLLLIGLGPKIALVPFLDKTKSMSPEEQRATGRLMVRTAVVTALVIFATGALLTLARDPWYPGYGGAAPLWGLTPLEDQQLAGLIMWVPGGISYVLATAWLVVDWLRVSELRAVRLERNVPAWR